MVDPVLLTKPWFRKLRTPEKLAFLVILCVCDELGIWLIDEEWVEMLVGQRVDWKSLLLGCNGNIKPFDDTHLLIPDYFRFQYPRASRNNPVWQNMYKKVDNLGIHSLLGLPNLQYLDTANLHSLDTDAIPTRYQLDTDAVHKEKEKEEVLSLSSGVREDNPEDLGEEEPKPSKPLPEKIRYDFEESLWYGITDVQVALWQEAYPAVDVELELRQMGEWCKAAGAKGRKNNWRAFITNWLKRQQDKGGSAQPQKGWGKR
jgi:hypothetical protein